MKPRGVLNAKLEKCRRCGYETFEVGGNGLCMSCEEYLYRLNLRERGRGHKVPALPQPMGWPQMLVDALQKIKFWKEC